MSEQRKDTFVIGTTSVPKQKCFLFCKSMKERGA